MTQGVKDPTNNRATFLILVVDDDEDIRELITHILGGEFQLFGASDGSSALIQIEQRQPDLILLDLMLPDTSGLEVLRQIRSNSEARVRQIPVILLSAMIEKPDFKTYTTVGATEFLAKPFQAKVLVERVTAMVNANNRNASPLAKMASPRQNTGMELPVVQSLVLERRTGVLERAIAAVEVASINQLQTVSHKIAGALLLYSFVEEGGQARTFSKWLATDPQLESTEVLRRRNELLNLLRSAMPESAMPGSAMPGSAMPGSAMKGVDLE